MSNTELVMGVAEDETELLKNMADDDVELLKDVKEEPFAVKRTWKHFLLLPIVVLFFMGYGMFMYLRNEWTQYALSIKVLGNATAGKSFKNCSETTGNANKSHDSYDYVQEQTAQWQTYFNIAFIVPSILCTMIIPSYSDKKGRKFILGISISCVLVKYIICAFVIYFNLDFIYMLLGHIVEGLGGSLFSLLSGAFSFMADITNTAKERAFAITVIEGSLVICITLSGFIVGVFISAYGYGAPTLTVAGLTLLALLCLLVLPETVAKKATQASPSLVQTFRRMFKFYVSVEYKGKRLAYVLLIVAFCMTAVSSGNRSSVETTYQLGLPFCWPSTYIGYFAALRNGGQGIVGIVVFKLLQCCSLPNEAIAIFSALSNLGSYVLEALAKTDVELFMVPLVAVLSSLCLPLIRSMMSLMTPADKQGALFASITTVEGAGSLAGTLVGNSIYAATVSIMPGFVFFVLAIFDVVTIVLLIIYAVTKPKAESYKQTMMVDGQQRLDESDIDMIGEEE